MDITVIVATHKYYRMPEDQMYLPLHVGREGNPYLGFLGDNTGDNISKKNLNFCELTGLYWAWKNLDADYIGLVHYRRHFTCTGATGDKWNRILTGSKASELLQNVDILVPHHRNYFIETNYSQYAHAHHSEDLNLTREIISEKFPEYLPAYDDSMKHTKGHRFNIFIMKRTLLNQYCQWLFDILFELENRLDISQYSAYDARVFGFVGERLLDVWINTNKYNYKELPYLFMEKQNWLIKGANFIRRIFRKT